LARVFSRFVQHHLYVMNLGYELRGWRCRLVGTRSVVMVVRNTVIMVMVRGLRIAVRGQIIVSPTKRCRACERFFVRLMVMVVVTRNH